MKATRASAFALVLFVVGALAVPVAHSVISTKLLAGRTVVRVHSATSPGAGFDPVEPEMEDVYFSTMAGHYGGRGEQPAMEATR